MEQNNTKILNDCLLIKFPEVQDYDLGNFHYQYLDKSNYVKIKVLPDGFGYKFNPISKKSSIPGLFGSVKNG